jgi:hypothetical protein
MRPSLPPSARGTWGSSPYWDLWVHLFRVEPFSLPSEVRRVRHTVQASDYTIQLRSDQAQLYIPTTLTSSNKGWQSRWFYLRNDDGQLPTFTHHVVLGAEERLRWGLPREALRKLQDRGLTVVRVVAAFHRRCVLPLADRRLRLDELTLEASVECSQMASATLPTDELLRWVKGTVGKADYSVVVPMHPEQGYMSSLVSPLFFVFVFGFPSSHLSLTFSSTLQGLWGFRTADPQSQQARWPGRCAGWRLRRRRGRRTRKRSGPARRCWPMIHWRSTAERRRGRGFRSRPLSALRRRTTTTMRGWRSAWALALRSGPGLYWPQRVPLEVQPLMRRGRQHPCPRRGRQSSLPPSLPRWKRRVL